MRTIKSISYTREYSSPRLVAVRVLFETRQYMTDLQLLFKEIDRVKNESELRSHLAPQIGEYFTATRSQVFFFDHLLSNPKFKNILKIALSTEHNPVARYLAERHAPVHEEMVTSPKAWNIICPRPDHWHVMAGPIVNRGHLVGVVGCTREKSMPAFNTENLADLSAICLHLSVWSATVKSSQYSDSAALLTEREARGQQAYGRLAHPNSIRVSRPPLITVLTPRELEIAELVAKGKTNAEIGRELWITINSVKQALKRMFRKLEVSSRAEMVAKLFTVEQHSLTAK